jgi:hypothetical protein
MWYCSLCDLNLGEICTGSDQNNQPTCPYCHGAVEIGTKPLERVAIGKVVGSSSEDYLDISQKVEYGCSSRGSKGTAPEPMIEYIMNMISGSLEESKYAEYAEDIMHIVRSSFGPRGNIVQREITKMVLDSRQSSDAGLIDLEESFDEEGVLIARAISDVTVAIGDLNERLVRIEGTRSFQQEM